MTSGTIPKGRSKDDEKLTAEEWKEFRSVSGSLQWVASQSRPEVGPVVSLSNKGQLTSFHDLKRLYETVDYLKLTSEYGLCCQDIPISLSTVVLTYTDSSWANGLDLKSQYGVLVLVAAPQVSEVPSKATLIDWKTARSSRVCRSTLSAEASAADEGADRASFTNMSLSELLLGEPAHRLGCKMNNLHAVDAKSLFDCLIQDNPNVTDKRSLINIRSVQETVSPQQVHWVPTSLMHADGLTKLDTQLMMELGLWLQDPRAQLREVREPKKSKTSVKSCYLST